MKTVDDLASLLYINSNVIRIYPYIFLHLLLVWARILKEQASKGGWVTLKNIHLCISWLPTLEKELEKLEKEVSETPGIRIQIETLCSIRALLVIITVIHCLFPTPPSFFS